MTVRVTADDARNLAAYASRQLAWDPSLAARVVTRERALGVYTAPPMNVLAFAAIPAEVASPGEDRIVTLSALVQALADPAGGLDLASLPEAEPAIGAEVGIDRLPPAEGWQLPIHGVAGDLIPAVDAAAAEVAAKSANLSPTGQRVVAQDVWNRPAWGGLPMRALLAAQRLGLIAADSSRVAAATSGPWRRLSTPRGQIFVLTPRTRLDMLGAR